ncbi:MAG: GntR family transcriptional regulator [Mesorhizobium sp.]|nr:GntR family transcriptional regulator [Mesorhizobium sp.]
MSRTPVREALEKLLTEGLLSTGQGRGVVVAELDRTRVIQIYALRGILEGAACAFAALHASQAEIEELRSIHEHMAGFLSMPDRLLKANRQFHLAIYSAAHNQYLVEAAARLADTLSLLPGTTYSVPDRPQSAQAEHAAILDAIIHRDPGAAEAHARDHIDNARRLRLRQLFGESDPIGPTVSR